MPAGALAAPPKFVRLLAVTFTVAALGGCSQVGDLGTLSPLAQGASETQTAAADPHKATEASAKALVSNPRDLKSHLAHARNLKQLGDKSAAMAVLQAASEQHGNDRELASEYGRLAADLDQLSLASKLLAIAEDPARPDWKVISARGTVLAKQGRYDDALPLFERALALDPGNPSLINNLALARAAAGDAAGAESLLRQAAAARPADSRIRNNLALVEKLQGRAPSAPPAATAPAAPAAEPVRAAAAAPRPAAPAPATARTTPAPVQATPVVARAPEPPRAPPTAWQTATMGAPPASVPAPAPARAAPPAAAIAAAPAPTPAPTVAGWTMRVDTAPAPAAPPIVTAAPAVIAPVATPAAITLSPPLPAVRPVVAGWSADIAKDRTPQAAAPVTPPVALVPPAADETSGPVDLPSPYWRPIRK
jgi:Flp pilus assembly protein TadD